MIGGAPQASQGHGVQEPCRCSLADAGRERSEEARKTNGFLPSIAEASEALPRQVANTFASGREEEKARVSRRRPRERDRSSGVSYSLPGYSQ